MSLQQFYKKEVLQKLSKELGIENALALPRLMKVVINVGIRQDQKNAETVKTVEQTLSRITGQKPQATKARTSIATFKIRQGMEIGYKVTLRGKKMDDFLTKLINITFPRIRDFRGIPSSSVDREGNLTMGIREHIVFPEIRADEVERIHGLSVTVVTNARNHDHGYALFQALGFPFERK